MLFYLIFLMKRPLLRIEQGRLKPIDNYVRVLLLYQNKLAYTESFENYMKRPIKYLKQLNVEDLRDLVEEANVFFFSSIF